MAFFEITDKQLFILVPLLVGFLLDLFLGDPLWLPHPIRLFGNMISFGEKILNKNENRRFKGMVLVFLLVLLVFGVLWLLNLTLIKHALIYLIYSSIMVFYGLANKTLIVEALKVERKLNKEGLEAARIQLSYIVGRDTTQLNKNQVRIAVLETLSENLSDGVVGPLFFYAIGGVPLMLAYKMVNTLDSMIGYKNERYLRFGWFAAKLDDVINYIPARLTAMIMLLLTFSMRGVRFVFMFGNKHASPNAGYPEAVLAGVLNCRFGGPNIYHGKLVEKPFIGIQERLVFGRDIKKACTLNMAVTIALTAIIAVLVMLFVN